MGRERAFRFVPSTKIKARGEDSNILVLCEIRLELCDLVRESLCLVLQLLILLDDLGLRDLRLYAFRLGHLVLA
eukprot:scaffold602_cov298-Pinguiococcus_pyrenoidosus.AAC.25